MSYGFELIFELKKFRFVEAVFSETRNNEFLFKWTAAEFELLGETGIQTKSLLLNVRRDAKFNH